MSLCLDLKLQKLLHNGRAASSSIVLTSTLAPLGPRFSVSRIYLSIWVRLCLYSIQTLHIKNVRVHLPWQDLISATQLSCTSKIKIYNDITYIWTSLKLFNEHYLGVFISMNSTRGA